MAGREKRTGSRGDRDHGPAAADPGELKIIDIHTHAFPDAVAVKAMMKLEANSKTRAVGDGTVSSLLSSMSSAGISASVIASIATKPGQSAKITAWSVDILKKNPSLIPFGSVHPEGDWKTDLDAIKSAGLAGVKLHPYYQNFLVDDDRMLKIYEYTCKLGLVLLFHAGYDMGYERYDCANPKRFYNIWKRLPDLKAVLAHLGGWFLWDQVLEYLPATGYYIDTCYCDGFIKTSALAALMKIWPKDRILFGSDFPWAGQKEALGFLDKLGLTSAERQGACLLNARRLLNR